MKQLLLVLAKLLAPFVVGIVLLLRRPVPKWFLTPDDPVSPYGQYEETVRKVYERFGKSLGDFYWLGLRNKAYGLAYHWKPDFLKGLTDYTDLNIFKIGDTVYLRRNDKFYKETTKKLWGLTFIYGYRLSPILNWDRAPRPLINMDGRPILTVRLND